MKYEKWGLENQKGWDYLELCGEQQTWDLFHSGCAQDPSREPAQPQPPSPGLPRPVTGWFWKAYLQYTTLPPGHR